jgi:PPOX class probable F420-dependent enzyme
VSAALPSAEQFAAVRAVAAPEKFLAVVSTVRQDGSPHASLVNAGLLDHPVSGATVAGFVAYGPRKLENLRVRPQLTLTWRSGWSWIGLDGRAELAGLDDDLDGWSPDERRQRLPGLLRDVFTAAGGTHDDWTEYDRVMAEQRRVVVLVTPVRIYGNHS